MAKGKVRKDAAVKTTATVRKQRASADTPAARRAVAAGAKSKVRRRAAAGSRSKAPRAGVHGRAAGSPQIIASLTVRSPEAAIAFYIAAFGFRLEFTMPGPDGGIAHAQMTFHDGRIMLAPEGAYVGRQQAPASSGRECPMQQYVYCPDVDALTARARSAGATVINEPTIMFWGDRMATFLDADGYRWAFATNVAEFDAAQMPDVGFAAQA